MDLTEPTKKEKRQNRAYKERKEIEQSLQRKKRDRTEPTKKLYTTKSDLALLKYKKPNSIYK